MQPTCSGMSGPSLPGLRGIPTGAPDATPSASRRQAGSFSSRRPSRTADLLRESWRAEVCWSRRLAGRPARGGLHGAARTPAPSKALQGGAMSFREATTADLSLVASWVRTRRECDLWAGSRFGFPFDLHPARPDAPGHHAVRLPARRPRGGGLWPATGKDRERVHLMRVIVKPRRGARALAGRFWASCCDAPAKAAMRASA